MQNNYDNRKTGYGDVVYAGFWVRLAAYVLDSVIVFLMLLAVRLVLSGILSIVRGTVLGGNILFHYTLKDIVLYLGQVLYFILCTRYTGTTIGKKAMNLRVVNADGSTELDFLTVVYRETVGRFLCRLPMCIGYLMTGLDKEKRGIHDMLCDTRVVYAKKVKAYPAYYPTAPVPPTPGNVPPMDAGMLGKSNSRPTPPVGAGTLGQLGSGGTPSTGSRMPSQSGSGWMPSAGTGMSGQPGTGAMPQAGMEMKNKGNPMGMPPGYPMDQNSPYRMVHPQEQNLNFAGGALQGEDQRHQDGREKSHQEMEEIGKKEDFNRS